MSWALLGSLGIGLGCSAPKRTAVRGGDRSAPGSTAVVRALPEAASPSEDPGVNRTTGPREAEETIDRKIEPADTVIIDVFGEKDFSGEHRVQAGGTITFPLLGIVKVGGRTTSEVAIDLADRLRDGYLKDPQVTVNVKEYRLRTVSVMGFVEKPSAVKMPSEFRIDILEAIAEAGGFSRTANKNKIDLTRNGKTTTYSFDQLRKQTDSRKRIWLQPGDVIYVHEGFI